MCRYSLARRPRTGFTLVELLVVILIIALLISILLPVISKVRQRASAAACQSNIRQLGAAWVAYVSDNGGNLPKPTPSSVDGRGSWLAYPLQPETEDTLRGGLLFSYLRDVKVYRCPAEPQEKRLRSYSMSARLGTRLVSNISELRHPTQTFVFIEDAELSGRWAAGSFTLGLDGVAGWHGGASLAFADGHAEYFAWSDRRTLDMWKGGSPSQPDSPDFKRIAAAYDPQ